MFHPKIDLEKPGVKRLGQMGAFAVIANKKLHDNGKAHRFAVVNTLEQWLDSIHPNYQEALSYTQSLMWDTGFVPGLLTAARHRGSRGLMMSIYWAGKPDNSPTLEDRLASFPGQFSGNG